MKTVQDRICLNDIFNEEDIEAVKTKAIYILGAYMEALATVRDLNDYLYEVQLEVQSLKEVNENGC